MQVRQVILLTALVTYLVPLVVGLWLVAFREVGSLARIYYRHHYLFDLGFTALASVGTGLAAYFLLRSMLAPWLRLEAQLGALIEGRGRLEPVGDAHADRIVNKINELLSLQRDVQALEELTKNTVAQALHDGAVQSLIAARWALRQGRIEAVEAAIQEAERAIRSGIAQLSPPELTHLPLSEAIVTLARRMGLEVEVFEDGVFSEAERAEIYRIVRHAMENARRHGGASRVWVQLSVADEVTVVVEDDGRGLPEPFEEGQGLGILRARMRMRGGRLTLSASEQGGARLEARWPAEGKTDAGADR